VTRLYSIYGALVVLGIGLLPPAVWLLHQYRQAAWIGWPVAIFFVWVIRT
jgi:hypothetical protein